MMKLLFGFLLCVFLLPVSARPQDFEFQVDIDGKAFYEDSVGVLYQNLDSAFIRISSWATTQVRTSKDTLIFTQNKSANVWLKKVMEIPDKWKEDVTHLFILEITVLLQPNKLKYKVFNLHHINNKYEICGNLGNSAGACEFEGNPSAWNFARNEVDTRINELLRNLEEFMGTK